MTLYTVEKKYKQSAVLYLDGLSAYDVWFYSDIVTSSSVKVLFYGHTEFNVFSNTITPHAEIPVKVTTEEIGVPSSDAQAPYSIEIEFEYYDSK